MRRFNVIVEVWVMIYCFLMYDLVGHLGSYQTYDSLNK